jgi:diamine N-acetyltransferase
MTLTIRPAASTDAARLSMFAAETFRETFGRDNDAADLESYLGEAFTVDRQVAEINDPNGAVIVAEALDSAGVERLAGYAYLVQGDAPAAITGAGPIELKRLYVGKAWQGLGVAHALMDAALTEARSRAAQTLWLGVWERNARAVAFYRKYGFQRVGEHLFQLGSDLQTDWLLALDLHDREDSTD